MQAKENPGAEATATGVKDDQEAHQLHRKYSADSAEMEAPDLIGPDLQATISAFNSLSEVEQRAFAGAVMPIHLRFTEAEEVLPNLDLQPLPRAFASVADEYRKSTAGRAGAPVADFPDFDDPDFEAKLFTETAPIDIRKRLLVRVWNTFTDEDRLSFLRRVARPSELRRAAA